MIRLRRLITTVFLLLSLQIICSAQASTQWDDLLDRYERICRMCLEGQREAGLRELASLKEEIKGASERMPAAAKRRYEAIRDMYASGVVRDTRPLPYPEALQPLYLISPVDLPAGCLCGPMPVPGAIPKVCYRFSASVTSLVLPEFTPGVKLAYLGHMLGGYAGIYSNFSNHHPSYQALSDGSADGFPVWTSGASAVDRLFVTVGPVLRLTDRFSMYGGLGYGMRRLCWEDSEGTWMEIDDISRRGLCAELGASFRLGRVELSAGWLGLPFSYNALSLSAGFTFGRSYLKY